MEAMGLKIETPLYLYRFVSRNLNNTHVFVFRYLHLKKQLCLTKAFNIGHIIVSVNVT